jgi:hypothetical protein
MASGAAGACNLPADIGHRVQGLALELRRSPKITVANGALAQKRFSLLRLALGLLHHNCPTAIIEDRSLLVKIVFS